MLAPYTRKANIAGSVWLICLVALVATISSTGQNIWDSGNIAAQLVMVVAAAAWFYALGAYAMAKGHSAWWAAAGMLTVIGLVAIIALPDRQDGHATLE
jgi:hypothetical protein